MPSVHYKFKSSLDYKTLMFEGIQISVGELKKLIYENEKIGKSADFDLQITNAQTKQVYEDESAAVQRNASVIVARVPTAIQQKLPKVWDTRNEGKVNRNPTAFQPSRPAPSLFQGNDLATNSVMSEDEKLKVMQHESTQDYDPSQYLRGRQIISRGPAPATLRCNKCGQIGDHWIKDCPLLNVRRPTGIPKDELMETTPDDPQAMLAPGGRYVVPIMDKQAHMIGKKERPPFFDEETPVVEPEPKKDIPSELTCALCNDLLREAVVIPCCGYSFCDECIRNRLLESGHECPRAECREKVSPDLLVPNSQLRKAVTNFRNEAGYMFAKRQTDSNSVSQASSITSSRLKINLVTAGIARASAAEQKLRAGSVGPDVSSSPNQQTALGSTQSPDNRERDSPAVYVLTSSAVGTGSSNSLATSSLSSQPSARPPSFGKSTPPPSGMPSMRIVPSGPPHMWPPVSVPPSVMTAPPIHSIHLSNFPPHGQHNFMPNMLPPHQVLAAGPPLIRYPPQQHHMPITGPPGVPSMPPASSYPPPVNNFMPAQPPPPGVPAMQSAQTAPVVTQAFIATRAPPFVPPRRPLTEAEFYDAKRRMLLERRDKHRSPRPQDAWEEFLARKDRKKRRSSSRSSRSSSGSRSRSSGRSRRSRSRSVTRSRSRTRSPSYHSRRRRRRERSRSDYARSRGRSRSRTPSQSRRYNRRPRRTSQSRPSNRPKTSPSNSRAAKWTSSRHPNTSSKGSNRQAASTEVSQLPPKSDHRPTLSSSVGYPTAPAAPSHGQSPPAQVNVVTSETAPATVTESKEEKRSEEKVEAPVQEEKPKKVKEEKPPKEKRVKSEKTSKDSKSDKEEKPTKVAPTKENKTIEAAEEPKEAKKDTVPVVQETPVEVKKDPSVPKEEAPREEKDDEQGEKKKKAKKEKKKKRKHHHKSPKKKQSDEEPELKPKKDKEKDKEKEKEKEKSPPSKEEKEKSKSDRRKSTSEEKADKKERRHKSHKKEKRKSESGSASAQTEVPSKKKRRD